jgi:hypothetical protein
VTASRSSKSSPVITAASADERAAYRETPIMTKKPQMTIRVEGTELPLTVNGRNAQTLQKLIDAGSRGITAFDFGPGVRLAHYIYRLRGFGLTIETEDENHGGVFSGSHAKYRLHSRVHIIQPYGNAA